MFGVNLLIGKSETIFRWKPLSYAVNRVPFSHLTHDTIERAFN